MKKNKTLWILLAVFVVLIVGASVLYQKLGSSVENPSLMTAEPEETESVTEGAEEAAETAKEIEENSEEAETQGQDENMMAPDFTVTDENGESVNLSNFVGKPVIVNFWASWCGPCQIEMPDFEEAYLEYGDEIQFMMVNLTDGSRETVEAAKEFIEGQGYTFPVFYDTEADGAITYGVSSIPATYFIDAKGNAIAYGMGAMDAGTLQQGIDMILPKE